jgi:phasin family protein
MGIKMKTTTNDAETIETALHGGAEAVTESFEKTVKGYDQFMNFSKGTAEAMVKSASAAGKGIETINGQVLAYARKSIEESVAATKAIMGSKSIKQAIQLQGEFAKTAFETYVDELAKFSDLALAVAKDAATPFQTRAAAFVDLARGT